MVSEYGVTNDDVENVEQQSKHVLFFKTCIPNFRLSGALSRPAKNV